MNQLIIKSGPTMVFRSFRFVNNYSTEGKKTFLESLFKKIIPAENQSIYKLKKPLPKMKVEWITEAERNDLAWKDFARQIKEIPKN